MLTQKVICRRARGAQQCAHHLSLLSHECAGVCRNASETLELLIIRAGATLLTPWERFLYALSVLALTVLVCVGVSKAVQFYAQSLQQVMQRGDTEAIATRSASFPHDGGSVSSNASC